MEIPRMPDTSYLSLVSSSRISNYLGLRMDEGATYSYPPVAGSQYGYIQLPVRHILGADGKALAPGEKALRNQHIQIVAAGEVEIRGSYRFEVHPCKELWSIGVVEGMFYLEPGDKGTLTYHISLRKDLDPATVPYAVRIYMRA